MPRASLCSLRVLGAAGAAAAFISVQQLADTNSPSVKSFTWFHTCFEGCCLWIRLLFGSGFVRPSVPATDVVLDDSRDGQNSLQRLQIYRSWAAAPQKTAKNNLKKAANSDFLKYSFFSLIYVTIISFFHLIGSLSSLKIVQHWTSYKVSRVFEFEFDFYETTLVRNKSLNNL